MTATISPGALPAPPDRGVTTVAEHTVARIAGHALTEVPHVGGSARRVLGVTLGGADPDRDADVTARVTGTDVELAVRLSVVYPMSVRDVTESARGHLTGRVAELTGLTVSRVDIVVTALHGDRPDARRVR